MSAAVCPKNAFWDSV